MNAVTLRQWDDSDFEPFAAMNCDTEVMRYLMPQTRDESLAIFNRLRRDISHRGWGVWAVEVEGDFAGMVGLHEPDCHLPFSPCTEILWRLRKDYWGRGIAYDAATQAVDFGYANVGLEEIVSFTTPLNLRSIQLMERLGFERDAEGDFDHPEVSEGNDFRRHVLYRKPKPNKTRLDNPLPRRELT